MDFRDAWIYNPNFINPYRPPRKRKKQPEGYSKEYVDGVVADWKEYSTMMRLKAEAREEAAEELARQGKIEHKEFRGIVSKKVREPG